MTQRDLEGRLRRLRRIAVLFASATVALLLGFAAYLVLSPRLAHAPLADDETRREAARLLAERAGGIYDSHEDPDVARIHLANLRGRIQHGVAIDTNELGLRERPFEREKPPGTFRVVLLGDSFVFGHGLAQEDRIGVHLERFLRERSTAGLSIEVLHVAVASWNILSECAYLRRQLTPFAPDLVVHLVVPNDLDDTLGVRGFGEMSRFSPQHRERADDVVSFTYGIDRLGGDLRGFLLLGVDHEGRTRYASAAREIQRLSDAVLASGGEYLLLAKWSFESVVRPMLALELAERQVAYVSDEFASDEVNWVDEENHHWNAAACERVARLIYGLVEARGLAPRLALPSWEEADDEVHAIHDEGARKAARKDQIRRSLEARQRLSTLDFRDIDADEAAHVHAGISPDALLGPYGSFVLACEAREELTVAGSFLGAPEIAGSVVKVHVEEFDVGAITVGVDGPFEQSFPLPESVQGRQLVNVRLEAEDWVLSGPTGERCVVFRLERLALE